MKTTSETAYIIFIYISIVTFLNKSISWNT